MLTELDRSGLSLTTFAARHGIDTQRLYRWRAQLGHGKRQRTSRAIAPVGFRQVAVYGRPADALSGLHTDRFEVVLRSGRVVRVGQLFDPEALRRLLRVVDEDAC